MIPAWGEPITDNSKFALDVVTSLNARPDLAWCASKLRFEPSGEMRDVGEAPPECDLANRLRGMRRVL
jgi:hypothetical protein